MMRKIIITFLSSLIAFCSFGQIMNDSTVQVVGYWNKGEKQIYNISTEKYKVKDADTTARELLTYSVDVTIKDSTENSYVIDWYYYNFDYKMANGGEGEALMKDVLSLTQNLTVTVKTDELGTFKEVVNWKDIRDYLQKTAKELTKKYNEEKLFTQVFEQAIKQFSTKEAIEATAIDEIHQYYNFHGGQYTLGEELTGKIQLPNFLGGKPFDADVSIWVKEIYVEDEHSLLVQQQIMDGEVLKQAMMDYLTDLAKTMKVPTEDMPKLSDIPPMEHTTDIISSIHDSGWIIYSVCTKAVSADNNITVEKTTIEMQ